MVSRNSHRRTLAGILLDPLRARRDFLVVACAALGAAAFLAVTTSSTDPARHGRDMGLASAALPAVAIGAVTATVIPWGDACMIAPVVPQVATDGWTTYRDTWYGFTLRYPSDWVPTVLRAPVGARWERRLRFAPRTVSPEGPYDGIDVTVYPVVRAREASATEEYPVRREPSRGVTGECADIEGHVRTLEGHPAGGVYVPAGDRCYHPALLLDSVRGAYRYTVAPHPRDGSAPADDPVAILTRRMPVFFGIVATWQTIPVVRPAAAPPRPPAPRVTAPLPVSFVLDAHGRRVCAKKNDKPSRSEKTRKRHMDMECCLDPDEDPNPHCHYDRAKYGKYL